MRTLQVLNPLLRQRWYEKGSASKDKKEDELLRAQSLVSETAEIEQYQRSWHELNLWNATLLFNRELVGFNWGVTEVNAARELWPYNLHTENLIEEIGEAMISKASSSPLRPSLVPTGKSWKTERAVRKADNFLYGLWRQTKSEDACVSAFLDSFWAGIGAVMDVYDEDTGLLCTEALFPDNIIIDNRECMNRRSPRTIRIRSVVPRASIEAKYGELPATQKYADYRRIGEGYEIVVEAFRLPDANGEGGWHGIACGGRMLVDEPWTEDWFPVEFFHYRDKLSGFYCRSGVESLVPYQLRLNDLNNAIEESQDIRCHPRLLTHMNTQLDLSQWDNEAGRILGYAGEKPEPFIWQTELAELYQERERVWQKAFNHAGLSDMFAHAELPQGVRLDSSAGVREFHNMEDRRHLRLWTRFEDFRLRVAKMHLKVLGRYKSAKAYTVVYPSSRLAQAAKKATYEAVKCLTEDQYNWDLAAVPLSQMSPAARRETLRDWVSRGLMDDAQAKRMLTNPNLELEEDLEMASYDDIYRHIEIMENGGYEAPTELTNLTYGIKKVVANLHRLRQFEEEDEESAKELRNVIENHVKWIVHATSIQQMAVAMSQATPAPFQPTQGMPGTSASIGNMGPMAAPMPA
jgi:hypothetical protein